MGNRRHGAGRETDEEPHPITNDVGYPKSFYVDRAAEERYVLETFMYFPFTTAKNLTGFGAEHSALMRRQSPADGDVSGPSS